MALCSVCKKNTAVVFVNKIVDGKPSIEGLCLACAKKKGINPLASMMKQYGASDEDIENMNEQFNEIFDSVNGMNMDGEFDGDPNDPMGSLSTMFNSMLSGFGSPVFLSITGSD